jgi:hypothetical protein
MKIIFYRAVIPGLTRAERWPAAAVIPGLTRDPVNNGSFIVLDSGSGAGMTENRALQSDEGTNRL